MFSTTIYRHTNELDRFLFLYFSLWALFFRRVRFIDVYSTARLGYISWGSLQRNTILYLPANQHNIFTVRLCRCRILLAFRTVLGWGTGTRTRRVYSTSLQPLRRRQQQRRVKSDVLKPVLRSCWYATWRSRTGIVVCLLVWWCNELYRRQASWRKA